MEQASVETAAAASSRITNHGSPITVQEPRRTNLFGLDREQLRARFAEMGEKPYRADQIMLWVYRRGKNSFDEMTNIGKELRVKLAQHFVIRTPELVTEQVSADGTRKRSEERRTWHECVSMCRSRWTPYI